MIHLVLFEPEIPQNTGTLIRSAACLGFTLHLIDPLGFLMDCHKLKRAHMDYHKTATILRHNDWTAFLKWRTHHLSSHARLLAFSAEGSENFLGTTYRSGDVLVFGSESKGLPTTILQQATHTLHIPMRANQRSLNLAISATLALGKALTDTQTWPK